jgi:PilZ domain
MSNGQQAMADSARPVRSGGVLVNFPTAPVHPPEWPATRAAEEPTGSNPSSHDEPRLELQLCRSDATQWDDQSFSTPPGTTGSEPEPDASQCPVFSDNELSENPDPALSQQDSPSAVVQPEPPQVDEPLVQPTVPIQPKRSWLERWLFPDTSGQDKRSGARKPAPGLVAHFWTGGPPKSQPVRDISATGMYVVTEERWYLGTQIRITLTKTLEDGPPAGTSITVMATAVRWGNDGVGLEFVRNTARKTKRHEPLLSEGADGEQLGQFVEQFGATSNPGQKNRGTRKR